MYSTIATAGKRKSDDAFPPAAADSHPNLFASLSDENWKIISSFAAPPDIYNLSLSSVHFFREATVTSTSEKNAVSSPSDKKVLATQLLRSSLLSSLGRVLEKSGSGITLEAVLKMGDLPEGSALIAGSSIVAACLGKDWSKWPDKSDVDVYCSARSAPQVRSWLVDQANCMFVGLNDTYVDFVCDRLLYVVDTKIHHVEKWGSFAENFEGSSSGSESEYNDGYESDEDKAKYRKKTIQWGKGTVENANDVWKRSMQLGILGVVPINDGTHDIKPKPGGNLPFDFTGRGNIDLIVAKAGIPASSLLDGFDLDFGDLQGFFRWQEVPYPRSTPHFCWKDKDGVKHHREPGDEYPMAMEASILASSTIRAVRRDVPNAPFYRLLDVAATLPDRYNPHAGLFDRRGSFMNDSVVQAKFAPPIQFHNWCCALINRLRKYQKRGIEVVDAPTIAVDFRIEKYQIMFHGG